MVRWYWRQISEVAGVDKFLGLHSHVGFGLALILAQRPARRRSKASFTTWCRSLRWRVRRLWWVGYGRLRCLLDYSPWSSWYGGFGGGIVIVVVVLMGCSASIQNRFCLQGRDPRVSLVEAGRTVSKTQTASTQKARSSKVHARRPAPLASLGPATSCVTCLLEISEHAVGRFVPHARVCPSQASLSAHLARNVVTAITPPSARMVTRVPGRGVVDVGVVVGGVGGGIRMTPMARRSRGRIMIIS